MNSINTLLKNHYVEGAFHTHVSLVQPKGKFSFSKLNNDFENFWDVYCDTIKEPTKILGVAEKPNHYLPVLVDIDLKIKDDNSVIYGEHLYTREQCQEIINIYQSVLRKIVSNCQDSNLLCVLLEKPIYYIPGETYDYAKNGFHLHFPNLFLSKVDQEIHLLPRVKEIVKNRDVFKNLGFEDSSSVIDNAVCNNHWLLYGSRKSEDMKPYLVSRIIDSEGKELSLEQAFGDYKIYDSDENELDISGRVEEYLPRILSIIPFGRETHEIRANLELPIKERINSFSTKKKCTNTYKSENQNELLRQASEILPLLADWRSKDYSEWIRVGWILYNIGNGSEEALELWLKFSSRCEEKYDEAYCICEWSKMVKKQLTLGTLLYYAKIDSPENYKKYKDAERNKKDFMDGSHNCVAKLLYEYYGYSFVCASISNKIWYQFNGVNWEEIEDGNFLREKISLKEGPIIKYYRDKMLECVQCMGTDDKAEKNMYETKMKQITRIMGNLKSAPYKNNIMREAMEVFYDRNFRQLLDKNKYLVAFKNGVYNLQDNIFRAGIPEDYISKCLPIEYKTYEESSEDIQNVKKFLQQVFPDSSIRRYFLDTYSDIFVGGNTQKKVYLWTGEGDNGKSITQSFFDKMLGELAIKFNTQYFTGKKVSTGSANPELARAAPPVRHVTMEEPDADEQLNIGELKKLSGGDTYWARDLFERGKSAREVEPMFTLTFICNKLPKLKYSDKATWNRLRVIPFESTFVEHEQPCPETLEEQILEKKFPMDKTFSNKIPGMVCAFAWYLLEWRKKITIRLEPEKVREATEIYRKQNDIYRQFIEETIVEDSNSSISLTEIYIEFKEWYREGWTNTTVPIKNEVKEYLEKCWGPCLKGCKWRGYRIRNLQDDDSSSEEVFLN